jgi:glycosyltransferase involved in cell wall biosynthesis
MRITALVKSADHVCCRYRIGAFAPAFAEAGHDLSILPWSSGWFLRQLLSARHDIDVLIIQRKLFQSWQLQLLRQCARRLVFDFDDAIFLHSSYNADGFDAPKRLERFKEMMQQADAVVAGNDFLREHAERWTSSAKVHHIPTCVMTQRYPLAQHERRDRTTLAWIGSSSTLRGLERISDTLNQLGRRLPTLRLKVICDRSISLSDLSVEFQPWSDATETTQLASADIGISWLPDDGWSAGKCGLKVLQYMAAGLPVVANPVGMQRTLVRHGETGFLAETPDEWEDAVCMLANSPELRTQMGQAGRRLVESAYDVSHGAAAWQHVMTSLAPASLILM